MPPQGCAGWTQNPLGRQITPFCHQLGRHPTVLDITSAEIRRISARRSLGVPAPSISTFFVSPSCAPKMPKFIFCQLFEKKLPPPRLKHATAHARHGSRAPRLTHATAHACHGARTPRLTRATAHARHGPHGAPRGPHGPPWGRMGPQGALGPRPRHIGTRCQACTQCQACPDVRHAPSTRHAPDVRHAPMSGLHPLLGMHPMSGML